MVPRFSLSTIWEKKYIFNISRARSISLLFCVHQDTEYKLLEIEISVAQPVSTQKKTKNTWEQGSHLLKDEKKQWQFLIFMELVLYGPYHPNIFNAIFSPLQDLVCFYIFFSSSHKKQTIFLITPIHWKIFLEF